jgi:hypothetical protein
MDGRKETAAGTVGTAAADSAPLETVRRRRAGLRRAMLDLEQAASGAATGRETRWLGDVRAQLDEVDARFASHIAGTEGEDGLYTEVLEVSPRLANAVNRLRAEHDEITAAVTALRGEIDQVVAHGLDDDAVDSLAAARESINRLIARLVRHRQQGADLVFQAYALDIGGET